MSECILVPLNMSLKVIKPVTNWGKNTPFASIQAKFTWFLCEMM